MPVSPLVMLGLSSLTGNNRQLQQQEQQNQAANAQLNQQIGQGFDVGSFLSTAGQPDPTDNAQGVAADGGFGVLPALGGNSTLTIPDLPSLSDPIAPASQLPSSTENTVANNQPSPVGFNGLTPPQENIPRANVEGAPGGQGQQASGFSPFSNFFTGTAQNPSGLLRLAEGYNRGGLVGALGLLGTDLSGQGNGFGVQERIRRQNRGV